ncbi:MULTISPECIES: LysR family transcriptional regulator [Sphingomonas]|uniref:LysR family transcriptional regulator n=1 Tax=Sphingomonas TaxID=13687 RepID=UPI000DEF1579|nr:MULTISPECIES: LysR family transcriptional regulator [Sphingomonas]
MPSQLDDLASFAAVVSAGGFREAARTGRVSASALSEAVRRLETRLGLRLLHRTTRSIAPTEAGQRLFDRLSPALGDVTAALDSLDAFRDRPAGTLRVNVPANVARTVLPDLLARFLAAFPDIRVEITAEDGFVDLIAAGADAGIRYDERLEQDMIALPIGPPTQRFVLAAAPAYLAAHGTPAHPRDLLGHQALRVRFAGGATPLWEFRRGEEVVRVDPPSRMICRPGLASDLLVDSALSGLGLVYIFEDWIADHLASGRLVPLLADWWESFPGPFLYYSGRRHLPAPLRALVDFVRAETRAG